MIVAYFGVVLAACAAIEAANAHEPTDDVHRLAAEVNAASARLAGAIVEHPADAPTLDLDDVLTEMDRRLSQGDLPRGTYDLLITLFHGVRPTDTQDDARVSRGGPRAQRGRAVEPQHPARKRPRRKVGAPNASASLQAAGVPSDGPSTPTRGPVATQTSGATTAPPAAAPPPVAVVEAVTPRRPRASRRRTGDTPPPGLSAENKD